MDVEKVPAGHEIQNEEDVDDQVPAAHVLQEFDDVAPIVVEYDPAKHAVHDAIDVEDRVDDHVPALQ